MEESGILLITEKEDFSLLDQEKAQQESKELDSAYVLNNEYNVSDTNKQARVRLPRSRHTRTRHSVTHRFAQRADSPVFFFFFHFPIRADSRRNQPKYM